MQKIDLFSSVVLTEDIDKHQLKCGDIGVVVEIYTNPANEVLGYELEIFDALGNTLDVVTVLANQVASLHQGQRLSIRPIQEVTSNLVEAA